MSSFEFDKISALRISIASPEQIRAWSSGEVTRAETLNYRTLKPEIGGLFCERIFGPTKSWNCACGRYKRVRFKGLVCEKCGVLVAPAHVRRERMGHIELAAPVCHIWYTQGMPGRLALLLDLSPGALHAVLSFTHYLVLYIDEEARIKEIERIDAEIERLKALPGDVRAEGSSQDRPPAHQRIPVGAWVHLRREKKQGQATPCETSAVLSPPQDREEKGGESARESMPFTLIWQEGAAPEAEDGAEEKRWGRIYALRSPRERIKRLQQVKKDLAEIRRLSLLEAERYWLLQEECGHVLRVGIGAEAIQRLLAGLDLDHLARSLRREIHDHPGPERSRAIQRLRVVEALRRSRVKPEWMVMQVIPVLPPDLRPVLLLDGARFAAADINELYARVIHRNNRLKRFLEIGAPEIMLYREKYALQEACDALFDNAHSRRPFIGAQRRPLRSLSDILRGKGGMLRHNLLGKRVDYSGRSVITVGLELKLHQCGLPEKVALELFKPFIIHKLLAYGVVSTLRQAKRAVESRHPALWDILEEVMRGRVVLLNRAPTLHRLSIQAFEPVLVDGDAILLHPQVCSAFNADFDGDQMAVHLPLSERAQEEARALMLSTRNLLSPASGEPAISISQDMVLGCFYLTQEQPGCKGEGCIFTDASEAILAHAHHVVDLRARITVRVADKRIFHQPPPAPPAPGPASGKIQTTVGRLLFNAVLPERLRFRNYAMTKEHLKQILWESIRTCGMERTTELADDIKRLGFQYATRSGISFGVKDIIVPPDKPEILASADARVKELQDEWREGLITREELYEQTIALWTEAADQIAARVQTVLPPYGPVATIASSGATKARLHQLRQLSGMRGMMASPSGAIIETPVRGSFLEGLDVAEYFLSSHGARKSMMDRSLNTAAAGYLTIRFVNVAQDVIVTEEDCATSESLAISDVDSKAMGLADSRTRLLGRVLAISLPQVGLSAGEELNEEKVERICAAGIAVIYVRSVLTCQARRGVCRKCYGWDLSRRSLVKVGTAVGIIAAQSIGEPGTQLTMRTFHSGGIAGGQGDITQGLPRVEELFEARLPKDPASVAGIDGIVSISKREGGGHTIQITAGSDMRDEYPLPAQSTVLVRSFAHVQAGQVLALLPEGHAQERAVRARNAGKVSFPGGLLTVRVATKVTRAYHIPPGRRLLVSDGQTVRAGDPLTDGALALQDILRFKGRAALERYLLQEAQRVYRTTGAYIHDKHFEIIIRQMVRRVYVEQAGDTGLLPGSLVDRFAFVDSNARTMAQGGEPATASAVVLGLTRAALATESWLAAASFQQTTHVLTDATLEGRTDYLVGLKENVILGRRIPAGTGLLPPEPAPRRRSSPLRRLRIERKRR